MESWFLVGVLHLNYDNRASEKASVMVYEQGTKLRLSPSLQRILSLDLATRISTGHYNGNFHMDLNEDFKSVNVDFDLTTAELVVDTMASLLGILSSGIRKETSCTVSLRSHITSL